MKNDDVIKLLQHYRHDLMNQIQVIKGYASMKKNEQVDNKLNELIDYFNEERKLTSLNTPEFNLWVIKFNSLHDNIRLSYNIHTVKSLRQIDKLLAKKSEEVIRAIESSVLDSELYELTLELNESAKGIELIFSIKGYFNDRTEMVENLKKLGGHLDINDEKVIYKLLFPND